MNYLALTSAAIGGGIVSAALALWLAKRLGLFAEQPESYRLSVIHPSTFSGSATTSPLKFH